MAEYNVFTRYVNDELREDFKRFNLESPFVKALNMVNSMIIIVNETRQIIFANNAIVENLGYSSSEEILGLRLGEIIKCTYRKDNELGCGTGEHCKNCNATNVIIKSIGNHEKVIDIGRIITEKIDGIFPMDIEIVSDIYKSNGNEYAIINISDIGDKIRKEELEKIFYHDILNSAGGVRGILQLLSEEVKTNDEDDFEFADLALKDLIETIEMQRKMSLQDDGFIDLNLETVNSMELLNEMRTFFIKMGAITEERIVIDYNSKSVEFRSDVIVLKRILHNMIKNGIEATSKDKIITISCEKLNSTDIVLWVHNSEYIDPQIEKKIFVNRVSSKGNNRGWGTFSMKLMAENFLKAKVGFESDKFNGTKFYIQIPATN